MGEWRIATINWVAQQAANSTALGFRMRRKIPLSPVPVEYGPAIYYDAAALVEWAKTLASPVETERLRKLQTEYRWTPTPDAVQLVAARAWVEENVGPIGVSRRLRLVRLPNYNLGPVQVCQRSELEEAFND